MALPKRRHSKTRRDKRRTHDKLARLQFSPCPQCQKPRMPHRICPYCGYYKDKQVIEIKPKKKKPKR